ncbi:MAG: hypothetical protein Kilf2KO_36500 [Rhodospirillales bacterium]
MGKRSEAENWTPPPLPDLPRMPGTADAGKSSPEGAPEIAKESRKDAPPLKSDPLKSGSGKSDSGKLGRRGKSQPADSGPGTLDTQRLGPSPFAPSNPDPLGGDGPPLPQAPVPEAPQSDFRSDSRAESRLRQPTPATVGALLAQTRAGFGQDVEEVSSALRIRPVFLKAIEEGRYNDLPGLTYGVGFVRSYAHYLGLDVDDCVDRFKDEAAGIERTPNLVFPAPVQEAKVPTGAIILVSLILVGLAYLVWTYVSRDAEPPASPVAETPALANDSSTVAETGSSAIASGAELIAADSAGVTAKSEGSADAAGGTIAPPSPASGGEGGAASTVALAEGTAAETQAAGGDAATGGSATASSGALPIEGTGQAIVFSEAASNLQPAAVGEGAESSATATPFTGPRVVLRATQDSWVQIRDAGNTSIFTRVLRSGDTYEVPDQAGLTLLTGNAGGLDITVDGQEIPKLGRSGQVRRNVSLDPDTLKAN